SSSLGLGRASLYRILSLFEEKGLISKKGSEISIKNVGELKKIIK
ncbi:MAG: winged helix-turn-helix domain-containing protein, partial [Ruminococcaceae bacterium]|nr:winged helix-turn-helix domain-containing protein [Oscillospiraceae bacterium]